jgi:hypothetical protein
MIALNMARLLKQVDELDLPELSYPYVYSDKSMMKLFLYGRFTPSTALRRCSATWRNAPMS